MVKFYGTTLLDDYRSARVILVMEKCKGNLKSQIFNQPECIPGKTGPNGGKDRFSMGEAYHRCSRFYT